MSRNILSFFEDLLVPFIGAADDDELCAKFKNFNPEDEKELTRAIREFLLPALTERGIDRLSEIYVLLDEIAVVPTSVLGNRWEAILPPFDYPRTISFPMVLKQVIGDFIEAKKSGDIPILKGALPKADF